MLTLLKYPLILWGVLALGSFLALRLGRRHGEVKSGEFVVAVTFTGIAFAFLLSLLQVFVTDHYSNVRDEAQSEATEAVAMYDDLGAFPPQVSTPAQHEVVCYMRSIVTRDWQAQERGDTSEAPDTVVRGDNVRSLRNTLQPASPATQAAYQRFSLNVTDAGTARQKLLFLAQPQIPTILWVLVFVSAGVLMYLIISEFQTRPRIVRLSVLVPVILLMTVGIGSLAALDRPFSPIARVEPAAMTQALTLLSAGRHGDPQFGDCGPPATLSSTSQLSGGSLLQRYQDSPGGERLAPLQ
ncbi:MAG TPA: hypothetical protein VG476_10055 [Acidimicrobiales bacterium]|nr:hypothetical protein [Acidimicrobiales bacterium]